MTQETRSGAARPVLTSTAGAPVPDNQNSLTAGPRGPILLENYQLIEKLAHQNRERIPERVVHAKGSGAYGTLTVTHDISRYTRAKVFSQLGKKTEVLLRFSTVAGERGAADAERGTAIGATIASSADVETACAKAGGGCALRAPIPGAGACRWSTLCFMWR